MTTENVFLDGKEIQIGDEGHFTINEMALDQEMSRAGAALRFYGSLSAELSAQATTAKNRAEFKYTELAQQERGRMSQAGERVTEKQIEERVRGMEEYQELVINHIHAEKDYRKVENMYRILLKRCDLMTALSYKQRTEIQKNAF